MFEWLGSARHDRWSWSAHAGALAAAGRKEAASALVTQALVANPDLSIELIANEPGRSDAEHQHFIETMRLAGFPACVKSDVLAKIEKPLRLPECASH